MGRVIVNITVENYGDIERSERGEIKPEQIRRVQVEALVDSGATFLCLPASLVEKLGLRFSKWKQAHRAAGDIRLGLFAAAQVTAQGRDCVTEVMAIPEARQSLLGQVPLEMMDWWVDLKNQRLVGNREHGGDPTTDFYFS